MSGSFSYSSAIGRFVIGLSPIEGTTQPVVPETSVPSAISSADISRFYDNVQSSLPAVTLPVIDLELWNTIQEFCIRSTYYRSKIQWQMGIGVSTVDFNPFNANMIVVWVLRTHGLTHFEINPPAQLVDFLPPQAARSGWALLALRPTNYVWVQQGNMPELLTTWFETMLDGTLFRLYGMPAKPWSSPDLAKYHGARFRQGINRARDIAERLHSDQQSPARRYPYFAAGRRKN